MPLAVAVRIAYDGRFDAYARNPQLRTVEGELMKALAAEGMVAGSFRTGSRTDAGVCALENVVRCDLERPHLRGLVPALQATLPEGIWATGAGEVPARWNPRFGAVRRYAYVWPSRGEHLGRLREAAAAFVGEHDMRAFARVEAKRNPRRQILSCSADPLGSTVGGRPALRLSKAPDVSMPGAAGPADPPAEPAEAAAFVVRVESPGFLWAQVRRMVSAMQAVARGEATPDDIRRGLETGVAHPAFRLAPAEGLMLEKVRYEPEVAWDPEAGGLEAPRLVRNLQAADVQRMLAGHLMALAETQWPRQRDPAPTQEAGLDRAPG